MKRSLKWIALCPLCRLPHLESPLHHGLALHPGVVLHVIVEAGVVVVFHGAPATANHGAASDEGANRALAEMQMQIHKSPNTQSRFKESLLLLFTLMLTGNSAKCGQGVRGEFTSRISVVLEEPLVTKMWFEPEQRKHPLTLT